MHISWRDSSLQRLHDLLPIDKLRHARDAEHKGSMEGKVEEGPKLLAKRAEVLTVEGVKIEHIY
jgi:hypothetical protein